MVIGYISIASTSTPPVSFNNDILNEDIYSSDSYAAASNGVPQASDSGFSLGPNITSYVDPNTGVLYATGYNTYGVLGNGTKTDVESFTALYKAGDKDDRFVNPIEWSFSSWNVGAVIDNDGKLWTSGRQSNGALGNGVISSTDRQLSFEQVTTGANGLPSGYNAEAVRAGGNTTSTIVMLSDGSFYGAGEYRALGLSSTGGWKEETVDGVTSVVPGGGNYIYFTKMTPGWASNRKVVDFKFGSLFSLFLLDDGTLWRCNSSGFKQVSATGVTVSSFDTTWTGSYYVTSIGDVYYASGATVDYVEILSTSDYTGTIASIYTSANKGWGYLTPDGDVYFSPTDGGTTLYHIAEDVIYFDMGGVDGSGATFGAITTDGTFKLWGSDYHGQLGNGEGRLDNIPDTSDGGDPMAAFKSDVANVYNYKTADGDDIVIPPVNEGGETEKDDDGNYVEPTAPYINNPAPAKCYAPKK